MCSKQKIIQSNHLNDHNKCNKSNEGEAKEITKIKQNRKEKGKRETA